MLSSVEVFDRHLQRQPILNLAYTMLALRRRFGICPSARLIDRRSRTQRHDIARDRITLDVEQFTGSPSDLVGYSGHIVSV
jgi:hypothetical protein